MLRKYLKILKKTEYNKPEEKFKVLFQNGYFFFTLTNNRIFYLVYACENCPNKIIFDLIEEIQVEEKFFIKNKNYKFNLNSIIDSYEHKEDSMSTAQSKINDVKKEVSISLHNMIGNMDSMKVNIFKTLGS